MSLLEQFDDEDRFKCVIPENLFHNDFEREDGKDDERILPINVEKADPNMQSFRTKAFLQGHPRNGLKVSR